MDETPPPNPSAPPVVLMTREGAKTFSPSPDETKPQPNRREEDLKSYTGEWTVLILALLGWAATFCTDMAQEETFKQMLTPSFLGNHIAQLFSVTLAVLSAKRLR